MDKRVTNNLLVKFEVFVAVTMKNVVFWDVDPVYLVWTDVSRERIASIFGVEKSASEEPAWASGCTLSHQSSTGSW
jgi:hypothetical protein